MVGIYRIEGGLKLKAVSTSYRTAKKAIFNRHCEHPEQYHNNANFWWERVGSNVFVIEPIEVWSK